MEDKVLLFTGGPILTMEDKAEPEAVVIENDEIKQVGSISECKKAAGDNYKEINLDGKCLAPGFVDPHAHVMMLGMCNTWADVSYPTVKNIDELVVALQKYGEDLPPNAPILGFGFDKHQLEEQRFPVSADLDRVATDRPVQIMHSSGHCNVVNSYLMESIGINNNTPDPDGGSFGRDENGQPDGPIFDSANDYLAGNTGVKPGDHGPNIHMPESAENLQRIVAEGQRVLVSSGFTSVNDAQVSKQEMASFLTARDSGLLKIRIKLSFLSNYLENIEELGINSNFGDDQLQMGTLKLYADGSLISGTAYMHYYDDERSEGYLFHEPKEFKRLLIEAHKYGLQTMTHTQGDGAVEMVVQAIEEAQVECPRDDIRHRIEHCGLATKEQIERMNKSNIWPVPQPQLVYLYGNGIANAVGEVGENFSPYGWFKEKNVPIVLSSDAPVGYPNPFEAIYAAVTRNTAQGNVLGAQHRITLKEALKGYTIEAAKAMHREEKVGSIAPGKLADFAVLNKNPYEVAEDNLMDVNVTETWISGEKVFESSEMNKAGAK